MTTTQHSIAPEQVMAFVDGELSPSEAQATANHLRTCPDCQRLADDLRSLSTQIQAWPVETATLTHEAILTATTPRRRLIDWKAWTLAGGLATVSLAVFMLVLVGREHRYTAPRMASVIEPQSLKPEPASIAPPPPPPPPVPEPKVPPAVAGLADKATMYDYTPAAADPPPPPVVLPAESRAVSSSGMTDPHAAPLAVEGKALSVPFKQAVAPTLQMIARTVDLNLEVANLSIARIAMQQTVTQHGGFIQNLQTTQGEDLTASLRIPSESLDATLADLRSIGKAAHETQSGEDVSAQHQDLDARLHNDRITETRLQDILSHRTGTLSDVLEVEQEIARIRGEIEELQAEQQGLTRRVLYSTVELTLTQPPPPEPAATTTERLSQALTNGLHNVGDSILNLVLFLEEYGPTLLLSAALLAIPGYFLLRRYRRLRNRP